MDGTKAADLIPQAKAKVLPASTVYTEAQLADSAFTKEHGIAGSVIATWIGRALGWYREGQSAGFIMSVLGAVLLLGIYHMVRKRTA